ncbi:flavocytochrome c [uncultured Parasutterella sp.]|uniref:FAD-dependent oxidoreductase n=1 Tax=uncultured Parasutterella sp. TaxID=1263098 RepID=UPI0025B68D3E|nr:flavocytochrome c [uncultured Parasutterella sp.]
MALTRRFFLGTAPAAAAVGILGSTVATTAEAAIKWNETYNVVVIGAGGAGLTAAVSAKEAGAKKVVVLEKMMFAGGNTIRAGGGFNAAIKADYEKAGIKDSPKLHSEQTLAAGDGRGDPVLVNQLTEKAPESVQWLKDHGVKFQDHIYQIYGGLYKRARNPLGPRGGAYIKALLEVCKKEDIPIMFNTRVVEIIREGNLSGRVLGVKVEQKGKTMYIRATNAVVAAAGGFAASDRLTGISDPRMEKLGTTNHPGATGDVLTDLIDIGAGTRGLDYIQCIPGGVPGEKYPPNLFTHVDRFLFINLDGQRFIKEDARRDVLRDAMLDQPKAIAWTIVDADGFELQKNSKGPENEAALKAGTLYHADTIEDLAKKTGLPAKELKEAVDTYNKAVDTKKDPFGRAETVLVNKIIKAPFYAGRVTMKRHHTMGGVIINKDAQVIDRHGNVIPGLYAAGEVTGGIHGTNRVGGNAMADIFTYGRIAGVNAAKNPA